MKWLIKYSIYLTRRIILKVDFVKLNGCGNDFVFIENMDGQISLTQEQVASICDRHFGVGADGVILVDRSPKDECDAYMHYINSDGTLAQMCGNGVRCFAKYLVDNQMVDTAEKKLNVDTLSGVKPIEYMTDFDGKLTEATVDMGCPVFDPELIPTTLEANSRTSDDVRFVSEQSLSSPWGDFRFNAISMGNPHAVCFIDDFNDLPDDLFTGMPKSLATFDIDKIGSFYEKCDAFPEQANIEFAEITDDGINMRVYERGCGETLACGTGACATSVAATLSKGAPFENVIHLLGGDLSINWIDGHVFMTGPAKEAFRGTFDIA